MVQGAIKMGGCFKSPHRVVSLSHQTKRILLAFVSKQHIEVILNSLKTLYRPHTKFANVMFLHVSVCPQLGVCSFGGLSAPGGGLSAPGGWVVCSWGWVVCSWGWVVFSWGVGDLLLEVVSRPTPGGTGVLQTYT